MKFLAPLAAAAAALVAATLVFAHAEPVRVSPGDGAVLNSPPLEIVFEMSQEMARQEGQNDIDVFDASGNEITTIAAVIDNANRRRLSVALPSGLEPGEFIWTGGDTHLYTNHLEQAQLQLTREPRQLPTMVINPDVKDIFEFKFEDFELVNYNPHPAIKAPVAV